MDRDHSLPPKVLRATGARQDDVTKNWGVAMKVDGQCHCGQIRYEAEIDADKVNVCHCTDCQTLTGTAYRVSAPAPAASLVFLISGLARSERS